MTFLNDSVEKIKNAYFTQLAKNLIEFGKLVPEETSFSDLDPFEKFLTTMYLNNFEFSPTTPNFSLLIMIPPYLSANEYKEIFGVPFSTAQNNEQSFFKNYIMNLPFLVQEFNLPTTTAKISEFKMVNGALPNVDEITPGNSISITYYETKDLMVYTFHKIWMDYIEDVKNGVVEPDEEVIKGGYTDYAAACFILNFDERLRLKYLGYAIGLIPSGRDPNQIIKAGRAQDIATVSFTYNIYWYTEFTYYELQARGYSLKDPKDHPWLKKLRQLLEIWYG